MLPNEEHGVPKTAAQNDVPVDLLLAKLRDTKYINAFANPELFPLDKGVGKRTYHETDAAKSIFMKNVLIDPNIKQQELAEYNKMKHKDKKVKLSMDKQLKYEEKLNKAYDKTELNRRMRSISPDNFFKYKDFHGAKPDIISDSPTKYHPNLKEVFSQKVAGFESELTRKLKSKKLESPFEWKMDAKTPARPFRDRFKLGTNKVSGKITVPTEENAFLAMTDYLKKNKTLYNSGTDKLLHKSKSNSILQSRAEPFKFKFQSK